MDELLRSYLRASHRRRLIMPVRLPGEAARAVRAGANLAPEQAVGRRTWEDFLAERLRSGQKNRTDSRLTGPPLERGRGRTWTETLTATSLVADVGQVAGAVEHRHG
jgi:hypothetical protein